MTILENYTFITGIMNPPQRGQITPSVFNSFMATAQMQKFHSSLDKLDFDSKEANIMLPFLVQSDPIPVIDGKIQKPVDYYFKGNARTSSFNYRVDFYSINELSDKLTTKVRPYSADKPIVVEFEDYYEIYPNTLSTVNKLFASGTTAIGSNVIQCTSINTVNYYVGMSVSGINIPSGSYITAINSGVSFTINNNATVNTPTKTTTTSGVTLVGNNVINCTSINSSSYYVGMKVSGTNIPSNSVITSITDGVSFSINNAIVTEVAIDTLLTFTENIITFTEGIVLYYYRLPVNPYLDFTLDGNDRPVYGGGASVDLEFKESVQPEIMARFLMLMGVSIDDSPLAQYANLIEQKSNK